MTKPAFVYSPNYYADIGEHVFPTVKFRLLHDRLVEEGLVGQNEFIEPQPASIADLMRVHTAEYVDDLLTYQHTPRTFYSELPISEEIVQGYILAAGGTIRACELALECGQAMNLTGGFHHTFPDHAEGFCYINDAAVGIKRMQEDVRVDRAAVIDCDLHQGNGTAVIFDRDRSVFTFSIHQDNNYPLKQKSDLDIGLEDFTEDEEYLAALRKHVPRVLDSHRPELVVYLAGADPYEHDQLGGLKVTMAGLEERDMIVIDSCRDRGIAVCVVLAGGYAFNTDDTIQIHRNTARVMIEQATTEDTEKPNRDLKRS